MTLTERVEDLRSFIAEHHDPGQMAFVAVVCDGCGTTLAVYEDDLTLNRIEYVFEGWIIATERPYHDLCPSCA